MQNPLTRRILCGLLLLGCMWLAGCGGKEGEGIFGSSVVSDPDETAGEQSGTSKDREAVKELQSEWESLFPESEGNILGLQFYQGEVVRFRMADKTGISGEDGGAQEVSVYASDVYLDRADGSSSLLVADLQEEIFGSMWYMAQDGNIYCIMPNYENNTSSVVKRDGLGNVLYEVRQDIRVSDICQLAGGEMILLLDDGGGINSRPRLGELEPETGIVTELPQVQMYFEDVGIGAGTEGLLILDSLKGVREVSIGDGKSRNIMEFSGTSYKLGEEVSSGWFPEDIRISEEGNAEFLWIDSGQGVIEKLGWKQTDRISVVMRGFHFNNGWIKDAVSAFNRSNGTYFISLEEAGEDWGDFATQTSVQIASGGGPDLLYGEVLDDYIQGMLDKGGFEDLAPYMEDSGIKEEDYFPLAFSSWRREDRIYGINSSVFLHSYSMDASVLGENAGEPDIETLVDALSAHKEKAMYMRYSDSGDILEMFLEGSENLWGMLDWEEGSCDFDGELFAKMMEIAQRYAYDESQDCPVLASDDFWSDMIVFQPPSMLEETGRVTVGGMFDDGCHPVVNSAYEILSVNANSAHKQGAWEFIAWLLGEEGQQKLLEADCIPVSREIFQKKVEKDLERIRQGPVKIGSAYLFKGKYVEEEKREITEEDITEEWIESFTRAVEEARPLPVRTRPVLEIIREEAEDYFSGMKSLEEVVDVMENRVKLYLDENR